MTEKTSHKFLFSSGGATRAEMHTSCLSLFEMPFVDTSVEDSSIQVIKPLNLDLNSSVIEVVFNPYGNLYISLFETRVMFEFHIEKKNGTKIGRQEDVAFVSLPFSSMYHTLETYVNDQLVISLG